MTCTRLATSCPEFNPSIALPIKAIELHKAISQCRRRGMVSPCVRYLAAMVQVSRQYAHRLLKILETAGILRIIRRRISATRNDTNIYEPMEFTEGEFTEKQKQIQKPDAPAPPAAIHALKAENQGLKQQLRTLADRLAEQITFYRGYIRRGMHIHQAQQWRKRQNWRPQF